MPSDRRNRPVTLADLDRLATKDDLTKLPTRDDLKNFATKDDLKNFATKDDLAALRKDLSLLSIDVRFLRGDFVSYRAEFSGFKDWTQTTLAGVVQDIGGLKQEMTVMRDSRMRRIHDRLTRVEKKVDLPPEEYY